MQPQISYKDCILWLIIASFVGCIYGTISIVSSIRKYLVEQFGTQIFDYTYVFVGLLLVGLLLYCFRKYKTKEFIGKLVICALYSGYAIYYLSNFKYAIEKVHFVEYGLLGILVYIAVFRQLKQWTVLLFTGNIIYWIGIGDESIKYFTPNRVSEIRNVCIDVWSGLITSSLVWFITHPPQKLLSIPVSLQKTFLIFFALSTIATSFFIYTVHGFGYVFETTEPGRIYSSFTISRLQKINTGKEVLSPKEQLIYENEALRHLFQREFYFTNDFKASNGSFYRDYYRCYQENIVLENFYPWFMEKNSNELAGTLISSIDKSVAKKTETNPVIWNDTTRAFVKTAKGDNTQFFSSRVKEIIITSFSPVDLFIYTAMLLCLLGYCWVQLSNTKPKLKHNGNYH